MKKHIITIFSLITILGVVSCKQRDFDTSKHSEVSSVTIPESSKLFSDEDIRKIYSEATAVNADGTPASKAPIVSTFGPQEAPKYFNEQYSGYTHGSETRAFLNRGTAPDAAAQSGYITKLESISKWKTIKHADGVPVFVDAYALDSNTRKQTADQSDGYAPVPPGESHMLRMVLKKSFLTLEIDGWNVLTNSKGLISMSFRNSNNVNAPIVGAVIRPDGFKMDVYAFPYKNGWLVYGSTAVKIEKMARMYKPEMVSNIMTAMFNWLAQ